MRQKKLFHGGITLWLSMLTVVGLLFSCSEGFDSDETFSSTVRDAVLKSPELTEANIASKMNTSGDEVIQVSWKVVHGAGGYDCKVYIVDDPENPELIYDEILDGTSFSFPSKEDTKFSISVQTLGNETLNNKSADAASVCAYSTLVPGQVIPAGTENIVAWIQEHMLDTDGEQAFELEAGATYELNEPLDFGDKSVTFRGTKVNRPTLVLGSRGVIRTSTALKIKFINFDCTNQAPTGAKFTGEEHLQNIYGVIEMSNNPSALRENPNEKLSIYYNPETILVRSCMFKNVHVCLFAAGECSWGLEDLRFDDCIIQMDNDGSKWSDGSVFSLYTNWYYKGEQNSWSGGVKNFTLRNSTVYNIKENTKSYFMRWNNKDLKRCIPTELQDGTLTIENTTLIRVMTGKNMADRMPNTKEYVINFNNNVTYDTWRLQKLIQGNCTWNIDNSTNTVWGVTNTVDGTDKTKIATEEDPGFTLEQVTQELDLTKPNGGVNFKGNGEISSKVGDPRWHD